MQRPTNLEFVSLPIPTRKDHLVYSVNGTSRISILCDKKMKHEFQDLKFAMLILEKDPFLRNGQAISSVSELGFTYAETPKAFSQDS